MRCRAGTQGPPQGRGRGTLRLLSFIQQQWGAKGETCERKSLSSASRGQLQKRRSGAGGLWGGHSDGGRGPARAESGAREQSRRRGANHVRRAGGPAHGEPGEGAGSPQGPVPSAVTRRWPPSLTKAWRNKDHARGREGPHDSGKMSENQCGAEGQGRGKVWTRDGGGR